MEKNNYFKVEIFFLICILFISLVSAEISYCCEKTKAGAWCVNAPEDECDDSSGLKIQPTSCESTSYCRLGCCVDSKEGSCSPNTAQKTCQQDGGTWLEGADCDISQCQKGCCDLGTIIGTSFITQTQCKYISSLYNLETNFRTDIQSELQCIEMATSNVKGACIIRNEVEIKCSHNTKKECSNLGGEFYKGILCSSEKLGTNCGPSKKTTCVNEKVYYLDNCNNVANIYDSNRYEDSIYWTEMIDEDESCGYGEGNIKSKDCGNCRYSLGSICGIKRTGEPNPTYGDYICRDLSCKYEGKTYEHGESWCAGKSEGNKGIEQNLPGSEYFVLTCSNGEIIPEMCDSTRQSVCASSDINGISYARCVVNRWDSCTQQNNTKDCENEDKRDCEWVETSWLWGEKGICIPKYSPGFMFWEEDSEAGGICSRATTSCTVTYEKGVLDGEWKCAHNCYCLEERWQTKMQAVCESLGDCGATTNYLGYQGYNDADELITKSKKK